MSDDSDGDEYMPVGNVPDGAVILLCGTVVHEEDGEIGQIDIEEFKHPSHL